MLCLSLTNISSSEELKVYFQREGLLRPLLEMAQSNEVVPRKIAIRAIAQLALNGTQLSFSHFMNLEVRLTCRSFPSDEVMHGLFQNVDSLLSFLDSTDLEIQINGAMIVGNLARNGNISSQLALDSLAVDNLLFFVQQMSIV